MTQVKQKYNKYMCNFINDTQNIYKRLVKFSLTFSLTFSIKYCLLRSYIKEKEDKNMIVIIHWNIFIFHFVTLWIIYSEQSNTNDNLEPVLV